MSYRGRWLGGAKGISLPTQENLQGPWKSFGLHFLHCGVTDKIINTSEYLSVVQRENFPMYMSYSFPLPFYWPFVGLQTAKEKPDFLPVIDLWNCIQSAKQKLVCRSTVKSTQDQDTPNKVIETGEPILQAKFLSKYYKIWITDEQK